MVNGNIQYTFDVSLLQNVFEGQRLAVRNVNWCTDALQLQLYLSSAHGCVQIRAARGNHGIAIYNSNETILENVHMHTAGLFAFLDSECNHTTYISNSLSPRPTLYPGTQDLALLSGAADGIHIDNAPVGYACSITLRLKSHIPA